MLNLKSDTNLPIFQLNVMGKIPKEALPTRQTNPYIKPRKKKLLIVFMRRRYRRRSTFSSSTKLGGLRCSTLGNITPGLCLLCLGRHLCFLRLLFILGLLDSLFNLPKIFKSHRKYKERDEKLNIKQLG
jgi:hypothetical protein